MLQGIAVWWISPILTVRFLSPQQGNQAISYRVIMMIWDNCGVWGNMFPCRLIPVLLAQRQLGSQQSLH
jgi:hypothetical protein